MKQRLYVNSTEFKPKAEYILVKPIEFKKEETSTTGIVLSIRKESVIERPSFGEVVDLGSDVIEQNIAKLGDILFWPSADGLDLEFDDGVFLLLRYQSIIGTKK